MPEMELDVPLEEVDINCDMGESFGNWRLSDTEDEKLMELISSANIATGFHGGDPNLMDKTVRLATEYGVGIGAHPGYRDLHGFGRRKISGSNEEIINDIVYQVGALREFARRHGGRLQHVKPHGALYNDAASDRVLAELFVEAIKQETNAACLVGPPESELQEAARRGDLRFIGEAFVDRVYGSEGRIVPRSEPGAVHSDINTISTQAVRLATTGQVTAQNGDVIKIAADTLCIHGDTKNAYQVALAVRDVLKANGVEIRAAS